MERAGGVLEVHSMSWPSNALHGLICMRRIATLVKRSAKEGSPDCRISGPEEAVQIGRLSISGGLRLGSRLLYVVAICMRIDACTRR
jgi:hypothetical protein